MSMIKIGIAEDQEIYRNGLVSMFNEYDDFQVCIVANNGNELLANIGNNVPDVVLMDYRMEQMDGVQTTKTLLKSYPNIKILMLSMFDAADHIIRAIENGAHGYLTKDGEAEDIVLAIRSVMSTGYYLNDRTSKILITRMVRSGKIEPKFAGNKVTFTEIEMNVIKLICKEHSTSEIAEKLHKSKRTIDGHRQNVMKKMGAKNVTGVVMYAVKNQLIDVTSDEFK